MRAAASAANRELFLERHADRDHFDAGDFHSDRGLRGWRGYIRLPLHKLIHERRDIVDDAFEELLSFRCGGQVGMTNGAGLRNFVELVHEINWPGVLHV